MSENEEFKQWLRTRPDSVKRLMRMLPPACQVKANRVLDCPGPGQTGKVVSYFENGLVSVMGISQRTGLLIRAQCQPEWLEIVGYHTNEITGEIQNEEWIERILN